MTNTPSARPDIGDAIPAIMLETPDGNEVSVKDFAGKPLVLFFYPKDNTPGCTTEAKDFSALLPDFTKAGFSVLGISKDPPEKHRKFIEKHDLTVPLATDPEENGLADALGIWVQKNMYGRTFMGMERTTYLVDAQGIISKVWRKVRVKGHAQIVLDEARGA